MKKQTIALVVQCAPNHGSSLSAFHLAQTIVSSNEATLNSIFFYGDGAYHALNPALDWNSLPVDLGVCVASLQRRGEEEAVVGHFNIVGLGYLAKLYQQNDKVIVLG
jgi:sulfur relay (sulfurtransferase) complex TusBCD TusD component (DsrE family)